MLIKLTGIVFIIVSCSTAGIVMSRRYADRVVELEKMLAMLGVMETQIRFQLTPLPQIISNLCTGGEFDRLIFLKECQNQLERGTSFKQAWLKSIEICRTAMRLEPQDWDVMISLCGELGDSDVQGQLSNLKMHSKLLENRIASAREEKEKKSKMVQTLGLLTGILIGVIII